MKRGPWICFVGIATLVGCAAPPPAASVPDGPTLLARLRAATAAATAEVRQSLLYVEASAPVRGPLPGRPGPRPPGNAPQIQKVGMTALVLSADGRILLPLAVQESQVERVQAWVDGAPCDVSILQVDARAGLTVAQVHTDRPLTPLFPRASRRPENGEWVAAVAAFGEDAGFQTLVDLGIVRGHVRREFDLMILGGGVGAQPLGTLFVTLDGELAGLSKGAMVVSFPDLQRRIDQLAPRADSHGTAQASRRRRQGQPWIGAMLVPTNPALAKHRGWPAASLTVRAVYAHSPAAHAGLAPGDLIVKVDGRSIETDGANVEAAFLKLLSPDVGRRVTLTVLRDGKETDVPLVLAARPDAQTVKAENLGVVVVPITDELYYQMGLSTREGVLVMGVVPGSPAALSAQMGRPLVAPKDILVELHGRPLKTLRDFHEAVETIRSDDPSVVLAKVRRGILTTHVAFNMALRGDGGTAEENPTEGGGEEEQ